MHAATTLRAPLRAHLAEARCELLRMARGPRSACRCSASGDVHLLFAVVLNRGNPGAAGTCWRATARSA